MVKNITSKTRPPQDIESKANKMLEALLRGQHISRKNCELYGIANANDSIHSIASNIRNKKLIPVITNREGCDIGTYYIAEDEIKRFNSLDLREQQKSEMRNEIEMKRKSILVKRIKKILELEYQKKSPDIRFLDEIKQVINQK